MSRVSIMACTLLLLTISCQSQSSKAEKINELSRLIRKEPNFKQQLGRQVTGNESSDFYLFEELEKSDLREDSLTRKIKTLTTNI